MLNTFMSNIIIYIAELRLIDLSGDKGQFLQLKYAERISISHHSMGFLPNGDLILVSLNNMSKDYKIYSYSFINKPTNTTPWEYSQIYDIEFDEEFAESLKNDSIDCFVYQTKLFLFSNERQLMTQWNLLEMAFDTQYFLDYTNQLSPFNIVINNSQTLLALNFGSKINIFSMETGIHISRYG